MPRIFAIDWDRREVRALLLSAGPTGTSVAGAWAASLATADPAGLDGKQIGARLNAAVAGAVSGKITTLVAVGRDNVQIKLLNLPPAPAAELPELVRFQAEREFTALGADAALDFVPIAGDEQSPHQVLAVALSAAGVAEARDICQAVGAEPDGIPVRGCAAAAFATRFAAIGEHEVALIVNPLADEADLVFLADEKVVLLRTVRIPDSTQSESRQRALTSEIRRTIAAARQQLTDRAVNKVIICGNDASIIGDRELSADLEMPVSTIDPVAKEPAGLSTKGLSAETLGRFAAVLGMALDEANRQRPIVDFANVRKRAEVRRFSRVHALAAAVAVLCVLWLAAHLWQQLAKPTRELEDLRTQIHNVEAQAETFKDVTSQAAQLNKWMSTDIDWLDELEQMARRVRPVPLASKDFPVANDAMMTQLTISRPTGNDSSGGRLDFRGVAKSPAAVKDLEDRLRDDRHHVTTGAGKVDKSVPGYDWSFGLDVRVQHDDDEMIEAAKK